MAMWFWGLANCTLRRAPDVLGFCSDDSALSTGFEFSRRSRFSERWILSPELPVLLPSQMLLSLAVGNGLWSANGITPLSRRFDLLYPAPLIVSGLLSINQTILVALLDVLRYCMPPSLLLTETCCSQFRLVWSNNCVRFFASYTFRFRPPLSRLSRMK